MELGCPNTIVAGAGPAGLTAAYLLAERGERPLVLEASDDVGGLARTVERDGYRFDLGGHRFFTKRPEVEALWRELLGDELLVRPRRSRIRWRGRFVDYPLDLGNLARRVGPIEMARSGGSYLAARLRARPEAESFEEWVTARFGRRLYEHFFRSYTEKVWGVPASEIRAEWAAQRIRTLSLGRAVRAAAFGEREPSHSLVESFLYPRLGPGQMWDAMADAIRDAGGEIRLGCPVDEVEAGPEGVEAVRAGGERIPCRELISSLALGELPAMLSPRPAPPVLEAASGLGFRDFLTVALIVEDADPFPDNWVYVHDPGVRVGRIQNFRAWSPALVPDDAHSCLGLEYFCFAGDELWDTGDDELIRLAAAELEEIGLGRADRVRDGHVVRVPKAYPIYGPGFAERVAAIRAYLDPIPGLVQIGRNGLHRYNNADHSMLTAMRAVENLREAAGHDIWAVNADEAYHEESERRAPPEEPYRSLPATPALQEIS